MTLLLISHVHKTLCFTDHSFKAVSAVKLLQHVIANLNLKGSVFFYTLYILSTA